MADFDASVTQRILNHCDALGFDLAAVVTPQAHLQDASLAAWISEGRHAEMSYLQPDPPRNRLETLLDDAQSAVVVLKSYNRPLDLLDSGLRIARYAHGEDYHDVLRARLHELAARVRDVTGAEVTGRPATDSAPLLERDLARLANLGWVGKNTLLIHRDLGSFVLIAELIVDAALTPSTPEPQPDRCGRCARCIDACPTNALAGPHLLDARRCISYWTIEHRGVIPRHLRPMIGDYLFGCDICQDVCPWNNKAPARDDPAFATRPAYHALTPRDVLGLTRRQFNRLFDGSPIRRTRRSGLARNAAIVLGNRADPDDIPWLASRLAVEPDPTVRVHIAWALGRIDAPESLAVLERTYTQDPDVGVRREAAWSLEEHPRHRAETPLYMDHMR